MTLISESTDQLLELIDKHEIDIIIDTAPVETSNMELTVVNLLTVSYGFICTNCWNPILAMSTKSIEKFGSLSIIYHKYCPHCGVNVIGKFCYRCGKNLELNQINNSNNLT